MNLIQPTAKSTPRRGATATVLAATLASLSCGSPAPELDLDELVRASGAEVAVYYHSLVRSDSLALSADVRMHAASTMKIPVMIQLFRDQQAGLLHLDDSVMVTRTFHSIVDGSPFELDESSDSEHALYQRVGEQTSYRELNELMITVSSNLATNILIAHLGAQRVTETARSLDADSIDVLRGVEDLPAFEAGLSNSTTARDLGVLLRAIAEGSAVGPAATSQMIEVMTRQQFNEKIPAGLPLGTVVAHKTGNITGISHDAAIVRPGEPGAYVLVVMTRGFADADRAATVIAEVTRRVDAYVTSNLNRSGEDR